MRQDARQLIIDDAGKWWLWPSAVLEERFGYPDPDFDLWSYAVRNLGYVALVLEGGCMFIQYRPGLAKPATVGSLLSYLERHATSGPVFLMYYLGGWTEEVRPNGRVAARRIREIGAAAASGGHREPFLIAPKNFDSLYMGGRHRLADIADLWRQAEHHFSDQVQQQFLRLGLLDRTLVTSFSIQTGALTVRHCGSGFGHYDPATHSRLIGRQMEQQPDRKYGEWVAASYRSVATTQLPEVSEIDAVISHPARDLRRSRYQRLVLPWRKGSRLLLTSTSLLDPDITIPLNN